MFRRPWRESRRHSGKAPSGTTFPTGLRIFQPVAAAGENGVSGTLSKTCGVPFSQNGTSEVPDEASVQPERVQL